jgi:hypothetical protein
MRGVAPVVQAGGDTVRMRACPLVLAAAVALVVAAAGLAAPPRAGVLEPGRSLGGVHLGWTAAQVAGVWGPTFGRCRDCAVETRYYNRVPFVPDGAAVELRAGRVTAVRTIWAPREWHTDRGVYVGEPERRVRTAHGRFRRHACSGYDGLVLPVAAAGRSVVYVVDGKVWGFGLLGRGAPVCR